MTPRLACVRALLEWEKGKTFSDELLRSQLERTAFRPMDRAFLMETFYGVLRNLSSLDFLIAKLRPEAIDAQTRAVLRLGLFQLFHLRTPAHAAVHETVELAGRARGLVNAVLRRALREIRPLEEQLRAAPLEVRTSHPKFLLERWTNRFGKEATEALCEWNNRAAPILIRANGLRVTPGELLQSGKGSATVSSFHPSALQVERLPHSWILRGLCYVQDPSTLVACELLGPLPGERVLDACASPGGKTTYLAELMENRGELIAWDLHASRVERLRENLQRMGVTNAQATVQDAMLPPEKETEPYDRILVDAPCTNTGVLRRRVDVRWRLTDEDFLRMPEQQFALVRSCAERLRAGGVLVYSTCSLEPEENEGVVERIKAELSSLQHLESRQTLPFADGVDGAFAAKFQRLRN